VTDEAAQAPAKVPDRLGEKDRRAVADLAQAAAAADGVAPLSEDSRLAVEHGKSGALHLVRRGDADSVAGYLYLGPADGAGDRTAELCVTPGARRRGIGGALVSSALDETNGALRVWAHGSLPEARRLADRLRFLAVRELRLLELAVPAAPHWPHFDRAAGLSVRAFRPGEDDAAWLELNAKAFAHHPEQGSWTARDLAERLAEPWFDPAGFLLLEHDGALVGFHWTKVHPAGEYGPGPVGEVYVLGVDPAAHGQGFGRLLTVAGLRHLAQSGLETIVLYTDADNTAAVRLYESLGFHTRTADTLYERRGSG
jgi:mycothiol synthase